MRFSRCLTIFSGTLILSIAAAAHAGFVSDGATAVDQFTGTTKDTATWQEYDILGAAFTQNDMLITGATGKMLEYWTKDIKIDVGQWVSVRVRNDGEPATGSYYNGLWLIDKSVPNTRAGSQTWAVGMVWNASGSYVRPAARTPYKSGSGGDPLSIGSALMGDLPVGTFYTLQIERLSATSIKFSVTNPDNPSGPMRSTTVDVSAFGENNTGIAQPLYIALSAQKSNITWDDVRVSASAVPEPAAMTILGLAGSFSLLRRR